MSEPWIDKEGNIVFDLTAATQTVNIEKTVKPGIYLIEADPTDEGLKINLNDSPNFELDMLSAFARYPLWRPVKCWRRNKRIKALQAKLEESNMGKIPTRRKTQRDQMQTIDSTSRITIYEPEHNIAITPVKGPFQRFCKLSCTCGWGNLWTSGGGYHSKKKVFKKAQEHLDANNQ